MPAVRRPQPFSEIGSHIDLAPTFLALAGLDPKRVPGPPMDGKSLLPWLLAGAGQEGDISPIRAMEQSANSAARQHQVPRALAGTIPSLLHLHSANGYTIAKQPRESSHKVLCDTPRTRPEVQQLPYHDGACHAMPTRGVSGDSHQESDGSAQEGCPRAPFR